MTDGEMDELVKEYIAEHPDDKLSEEALDRIGALVRRFRIEDAAKKRATDS